MCFSRNFRMETDGIFKNVGKEPYISRRSIQRARAESKCRIGTAK